MTNNKTTIDRLDDNLETQPILRSQDLDDEFDLIHNFLNNLDISSDFLYKTIVKYRQNKNEKISEDDHIISNGEGGYTIGKNPKSNGSVYNMDSFSNVGVSSNSIVYSDGKKLQYISGDGYIIVDKEDRDVLYDVGDIERELDSDYNEFIIKENTIGIECFSKEAIDEMVDIIIKNNPAIPQPPELRTYKFEDGCIDIDTIGLIDFDNSDDFYDLYGSLYNILGNVNNSIGLSIDIDDKDIIKRLVKSSVSHPNTLAKQILPSDIITNKNKKITNTSPIGKGTLKGSEYDINGVDPILLTRQLVYTGGTYDIFYYVKTTEVTSDWLFGEGSIGVEHLHDDLKKALGFDV